MTVTDNAEKYYSLTDSQKILLWTYFLTPNRKNAKNEGVMSFYFTVNESPDCDALDKSFQKLLRENDSLRIAVKRSGLKICQYIREYERFPLEIVRLSSEEEFEEYLKSINDVIIDFFGEKHVWASIVTYGGKASLVMRVHHLCMDGYSLALVFNQLSRSYEAFSNNEEPSPENTGKIAEYFNWQRNYKEGSEYKKDRKYWANQYMHQPNYKIPVSNTSLSGESDQYVISLDEELYARCNQYCKAYSMSFVQLVMSASGLAISRMTGKNNFALSAITHGRRTENLRNTVGCMMNLYPVFYDIVPSDTMETYRKKASKQYFNAMLHSRFPEAHQVPLSYWESVKNGFKFNHFWILFSNMDYAAASEKSKYGFSSISLNRIAYHFYCSVFNYENHGEIKLNYQKKHYTTDVIRKIEGEFFKALEEMITLPEKTIGE